MDKVCARCNGKRYLPVDDTTVRACICTYAASLRNHLGLEIASAPTPESSPLLEYEPGKTSFKVDLTKKNLFIKGHWDDVRSHLKWALGCKGTGFQFRVTTDERLKCIYLGQESYGARSRKSRDEQETFNNLADFVGEDYKLILIRLGFLGYKNQAMPGILKEAIMIREGLKLPTWVIEDPTNPFNHTFSYSLEVEDYLRRKFQTVALGTARDNAIPVGFSVLAGEDVGFEEEPPRIKSRKSRASDENGGDLFVTKNERRKKPFSG